MSERLNLDPEIHAMAVGLLEQRQSSLDELGLRATVELKRWSNEGRENAEIRIAFWRENKFVDVVEDLVVEDGRPVASTDELGQWLEQSLDAVVEANRGR